MIVLPLITCEYLSLINCFPKKRQSLVNHPVPNPDNELPHQWNRRKPICQPCFGLTRSLDLFLKLWHIKHNFKKHTY